MPTAPTPIPNITTPVPVTSDPANFDARADLAWTELPVAIAAINVENDKVYDNAVEAVDAAETATEKAAEVTAAATNVLNSANTNATSTTSSTVIGSGSKSFTIQTGKAILAGQIMFAADANNRANRMIGYVDSYDSGTGALVLVVAANGYVGSGTPTAWNLGLAAVSNIAGRHAIWVPAGANAPRLTNGAASGLVETTTNKVVLKNFDFDASTIEYVQFTVRMPKSWDRGTVTFVPVWTHGATTTNFKVSWGLQGVALSDGDAADAAFGTAQFSNDTGGTTNAIYIGPESAAITIAGTPASEDLIVFQILRKADDATNDTLAVDARLLGFTIYMVTNSENDA